MADQKLNILITAKNLAKGVLSGLDNSLGKGAAHAQNLQGGLGGSILRANLLSSAISGGVTFALRTAGDAAQTLVGAFNEGRQIQLSNISAATSFSAIAGQSYEEATEFVNNLNAELAKSAAILPGATKDYTQLARSIIDDLTPAFQGLDGSLNAEGLQASLQSISSSIGALAAGAGVDVNNASLSIQKLLSGASVAEVRRLQFFEQNPALRNELQRRLEELGAESFADLDIASRVQVIQQAGLKFVNEDFRRAAGGSAEGLLQGFRSRLFDPQTGLFGVMRDLDKDLAGNQTIFSRVTRTLELIIGPNGIFMKLGDIFTQVTGVEDPLLMIDRGLASFNQFLSRLDGLFGRFAAFGAEELTVDLQDTRGNLRGLLDAISSGLNVSIDGTLQAIRAIDWAKAGDAWGEQVSIIYSETIRFFKEIDWSGLWSILTEGAAGFDAFMKAYLLNVTDSLVEATGRALDDLFGAITGGIVGVLRDIGNFLEDKLNIGLNDILNFAAPALGPGGAALNALSQYAQSPTATQNRNRGRGRASGIQPGDAGLLGGIISELAQKPKRSELVIANTSEAILRPNQAQNLIVNSMAAGANAGGRSTPVYITVNANFNRGNLDDEFNEFMMRFERMVMDSIAGSLN